MESAPDVTLDARRARIDAIDHAILRLLAERADIVRAIARWKAHEGLPMRDPARESAMVSARRAWAEDLGLPADLAESIARAVLMAGRGVAPEDVAHFARALGIVREESSREGLDF